MRHLAVVLAALLAVSPVAAIHPVSPGPSATGSPVASTTPPVVAADNTTEYLALPEGSVDVRRVESVTLDVGTAMAADNAAIYGRFSAVRLVEAYRDAGTAAERRTVLRNAADRLESRVERIRAMENRARERFVAGELTAREYLRRLTVIGARTGKLQQAISRLEDYNEVVAGSPVNQTRIADMTADLIGLSGPVRSVVRRAMDGTAPPVRVFVATSDRGLVLSAVVPGENEYLRSAYSLTARRQSGPDRFNGSYIEAFRRLTELYPWTWNHRESSSSGSVDLRLVDIYKFSVTHSQGRLTTYLDATTRTAFYEVQQKDLSAIPLEPAVTNADDDLFVQVNRTRVGGPLRIRVRNAVSLESLDARVSVNGHPVGRTGEDGVVWTVTPPGSVTVTATRGSANVTVTTSPTP